MFGSPLKTYKHIFSIPKSKDSKDHDKQQYTFSTYLPYRLIHLHFHKCPWFRLNMLFQQTQAMVLPSEAKAKFNYFRNYALIQAAVTQIILVVINIRAAVASRTIT